MVASHPFPYVATFLHKQNIHCKSWDISTCYLSPHLSPNFSVGFRSGW